MELNQIHFFKQLMRFKPLTIPLFGLFLILSLPLSGQLDTIINDHGDSTWLAERIAQKEHLASLVSENKQALQFPKYFQLTSVSVKRLEGSPTSYYLLDADQDAVYMLDENFLGLKMPDVIPISAISTISIDNLRYVRIKHVHTFSHSPMSDNPYFRQSLSKKFWRVLLSITGLGTFYGLGLDMLIIGSFPIFTASLGISGVFMGLVIAGGDYLVNKTAKKNSIYTQHLLNKERFKFKYDFKFGKKRFNTRALHELGFKSVKRPKRKR